MQNKNHENILIDVYSECDFRIIFSQKPFFEKLREIIKYLTTDYFVFKFIFVRNAFG